MCALLEGNFTKCIPHAIIEVASNPVGLQRLGMRKVVNCLVRTFGCTILHWRSKFTNGFYSCLQTLVFLHGKTGLEKIGNVEKYTCIYLLRQMRANTGMHGTNSFAQCVSLIAKCLSLMLLILQCVFSVGRVWLQPPSRLGMGCDYLTCLLSIYCYELSHPTIS